MDKPPQPPQEEPVEALKALADEGFNSWLASLPEDDWSEEYKRAIPVRWDAKTGTWLDQGWMQVKPVIEPPVRLLCPKAYELHPRGCPNYGKKAGCPPQAPLLTQTLDISKPIWAIFSSFDLKAHVKKMRTAHPGWSDRQLRCCLYWQGAARKELKETIAKALESLPQPLVVVPCPEAQGVNVTATLKQVGIFLEWPPTTVTYQVALAGTPHKP